MALVPRKILLLLLSILLVASTSYVPDALGPNDLRKANTNLIELIQPTLDQYFKSSRFSNYPPARVFAEFKFNKSKYDTEKNNFTKQLFEQDKDLSDARREKFRQLYDDIRGKAPSETKPEKKEDQKERTQRFGRLNIDLDPTDISTILEEASTLGTPENQPNLTVQVPMNDQFGSTQFVYDPLLFVTDLKLELAIPDSLNESEIEGLKKLIKQSVNFTTIEIDLASSFTINAMKPFAQQSSSLSFTEWFLSPSNSSVGILLAAIILGICAIISILLLSKVFSRIAGSISELKPEQATDASGGSDHHSSDDETVIVTAEAEDIPTRGGSAHDAAAALTAMTSEMRTIRDQLEEIIGSNSVVASELLRDLCYEKYGMEDFRDLLSFAGYNCLKEAMEKLPESVILQLQTYIEDNRDSQVNLIRGCEVAQRIYRDTVSKISVKSETMQYIKNLKDSLIKIDDAPLDRIVSEANASELALLLKLLSVERGNRLMKKLEGSKLKEACDLLDVEIENEEAVANSLAEKLNTAQSNVQSTSHLQVRFILRLAKTATIHEEDSLLELIPEDNWDLKQSILTARFLFKYVKYLPSQSLKQIFEGFELGKRADILYCAGDEIKKSLLSQYQEGSKVMDMMMDELSTVESNAKRKESVTKNKDKLLEELLTKVRAKVAQSGELVQETLKNEFTELGLKMPDGMEADSDQSAS